MRSHFAKRILNPFCLFAQRATLVGITRRAKVTDALIPDSVAVDQYGLLDRYRPIEYATLDDREFMGMNSWQFTLAVVGVVGGIVIIVSIIAVIIYRKKRLELIRKMKNVKV